MEILLLVAVNELGIVQPHGSENLLGVAFAAGGNLRLAVPSRPGRVQGGRLPEGGLVGKNDHRSFALGVFFSLGYV